MAARVRTVESVEEDRIGDTECWRVVTRATDGHGRTHVFPKSILEWRVAEFGIDLADVDALLDVVLHEQFISDDQDGPPAAVLAARSSGEARQAHEVRLNAVKGARERIMLGGKDSPTDVIRQRPGITAEGVREKRQLVDVHRWNRLYGGLPVPVTDALEVPRA